VLLIFDVVLNRVAGFVAGGAVLGITVLLWMILPRTVKPSSR
jgi:hypothetical protein